MKKLLLPVLLLVGAMSLAGPAAAVISIDVSRFATHTADGSITYTATVTCGPLPGTLDFNEGLAGAGQRGASAEGGLSPDVVCDGTARTYTAGISLISEQEFRPGRATAFVTVIVCHTVGDQQVCEQGSTSERVIVRR